MTWLCRGVLYDAVVASRATGLLRATPMAFPLHFIPLAFAVLTLCVSPAGAQQEQAGFTDTNLANVAKLVSKLREGMSFADAAQMVPLSMTNLVYASHAGKCFGISKYGYSIVIRFEAPGKRNTTDTTNIIGYRLTKPIWVSKGGKDVTAEVQAHESSVPQ